MSLIHKFNKYFIFSAICFSISQNVYAAGQDLQNRVSAQIDSELVSVEHTYKTLHQNPELSLMEKNTSKIMAESLKDLGFTVTENFGSYGVVGVLKNGNGPTVMVRTEMDALPIKEETGLDYASRVVTRNKFGTEDPAMHACGHDVHMSSWIGTARVLMQLKNNWHGTLIMIAQPAEEIGGGAKLMIENGLYKKFPKPDYILALHSDPSIPSGKVGYLAGYYMASADAVDITVYGVGGHGAIPEDAIDPILLASKIITDLQTIITREISPIDHVVVTVGTVNGGIKRNVISNEVKLQLSVRTFNQKVRKKVLDAIERITRGDAIAAGLSKDKYPKISIMTETTPSLYNNPTLTQKVVVSFLGSMGQDNLIQMDPSMITDDFSLFGKTKENIPIFYYRLGVSNPDKLKNGASVPSLHSSTFNIYNQPLVFKTAIKTMSTAVIDLMNEKRGN